MFKRYRRAQKWLQEQNPDYQRRQEEAAGEDLPSMEELRAEGKEHIQLEKGDTFAMIVAAFAFILVPCVLVLLLIVGVVLLLF